MGGLELGRVYPTGECVRYDTDEYASDGVGGRRSHDPAYYQTSSAMLKLEPRLRDP